MFALFKLIPKPYLILAIAIALAVSHAAAGYAGWKIRDNSARAAMQKETEVRLFQAQQMNAEINRLHNEARAVEAEHAARLHSFSQTYQERLQNVRDQKDKFIADVRAGVISLRIPPTSSRANISATGEVVVSASGCDAAARAELPSEVVEFLWSEASRADEVVEQLTACQAIVNEDRLVCGTKQGK